MKTHLRSAAVMLAVVLAMPFAVSASLTNDLVARYSFSGDGRDLAGKNPAIRFEGAPFVHSWLYTTPEAYHATMPVKDLDYDGFTVSLDFYPFDPKSGRRLNGAEAYFNSLTRGYYGRWFDRRGHGNSSNIITGGTAYRWFALRRGANSLEMTLNDQAFRHSFTNAPIIPKHWHNVICSVDLRQKRMLTMLDGAELESVNLPATFKLEVTGQPIAPMEREFTFVNFGTGESFFGYAANLKVFNRALGESDLDTLYTESAGERPLFNPVWATLAPVLTVILVCAGGVALPFIRFRRRRSRSARQ